MQTPKARKSSSEVPQKISPQSSASVVAQRLSPRGASSKVPHKVTPRPSSEVGKLSSRIVSVEVPQKIPPRAACQLKTTGVESDCTSLNHSRTPKDKSPKIKDRKSPRSPVPERKHTNKVADFESQISQLQDDLKKVTDELILSESWKQKAQQEAEDSKEKLLAMTLKLEESQQLLSQSCSDESHSVEHLNIEKDKAFQFELEPSQTIHSKNSGKLISALDEIRQLKVQLEMVRDSEDRQTKQAELASAELLILKENLVETHLLAEDMKNQLIDCKDSEVQAQALVGQTLLQLETAKQTVETLRSDNTKAKEVYNAIALELDQSKKRVILLEELVNKLTNEAANSDSNGSQDSAQVVKYENKENEAREKDIEAEFVCVTSEVQHLKSSLETAEIRYHEEQILSTLHITSAYELVEKIQSSSGQKEDELETELKKSKADIEELRANLMDKETELQGICEENEILTMRLETLSDKREDQLEKDLKKTKIDAERMKPSYIEKEIDLQTILEESKMLKLRNKKKELNLGNVGEDVLMKLGYATEEADKSHKRAAQITEQFEAARFANSELEAELRRIKVQSDQWRKAAEAAASILSTGNNGRLVERTGSLDSNYSPITGKISSTYVEDMDDDDSLKKKNGNVLKKIGVLWKKQQK
ncbi:Interactor of constitutive active ROPs 3 [Heracleum sosnowskyi]|uniref:Interactor of constitutive active ROPs 3 n=1 Tax=Heracleum sosnowskyi TaxID=360622 RepID=A0AAD8J049_9APIA|nr:Interactor of constitutive active ROPs 3 [Heracleum sosnowskyi]